MAALNFPSPPFLNQIFTANGKSWRYDGTSWKTFVILGVPSGGTGNTSYNLGDILVGAGTSMFALPIGSNGYVLTSDNTAPFLVSWQPTSATGITTLNGLNSGLQYLVTGTSGSGFNISSSGSTHTFNIPIAGSGATGLVSTLAQTFAGEKTFSSALSITDSTVSTSTSTGSLKVTGGVGIGGSLYVTSASNISGLVLSSGVVSAGVWAATAITAFYGGTGYNSYTKGDILVGAGSTFIKLNVGTDNYVLTALSTASTGLTWSPTAATGLTTLNGLNVGIQNFAIGTSGSGFNISSSGSTHTFNIPIASAGSTGLVSTLAQSFAGIKTFTDDTVISSSTVSTSTSTGALTVSGGVGIGGSLYTGTSSADSISGVVLNNGVITSGAWSATAITGFYGGTGNTSYTLGDLLVGAGSTFIKLPVGTNGYVLGADSSRPSGIGWTTVTGVTVSDNAPPSPKSADLWYNSTDGGLLIYYNDGDTSQWTEINLGSGIDLTQQFVITNTSNAYDISSGALVVNGGAGFASTVFAQSFSVNGGYDFINSSLVTSSTTADQVALSVSSGVFRTLKITVQVKSSTNFHSQEILMTHDGTDVYMTEYAAVYKSTVLTTFNGDINSGNIRLLVTPTNAISTYKIACMAIRD